MAREKVANTLVVPAETTVFPYYDDFDETKNFHRVLFRPGYAVQARELTQVQTILQNQIERFGNHIFAQGSIVAGGQCTVETVDVITVDPQYKGQEISLVDFIGKSVVRVAGPIVSTSDLSADDQSVRARVFAADVSNPAAPVLAINYGDSGATFDVNAVIQVVGTTTNANVTAANTSIRGKMARVEEGIFYIGGYFVRVPQQFLILTSNTSNASYRVGLELQDEIITENDDSSLLDPAQESFNYQAPGAARYKVNLTLAKRDIDTEFDTTKFISLLVIKDGKIKSVTRYPIYSELNDTFARRTYEESGNYTVDPFMLQLKTSDTDANNYVTAKLDRGIAYVKGNRFETISPTEIEVPRGLTTQNVQNYILNLTQGNYITVTRVRGNTFFNTGSLTKTDIHCVETSKVLTANSDVYNSTKIGTAIFRNMEYNSASDDEVVDTYKFDAYILDTDFAAITSKTLGGGSAGGLTANSSDVFSNTVFQLAGTSPREHIFQANTEGELRILFNTYSALNNVSIFRGNSTAQTELLLVSNTSPPQAARPSEFEILAHVAAGGSRYIGAGGKPPVPGESDQNRFGIVRVKNVPSSGNNWYRINVVGTSPYEYTAFCSTASVANTIVLANTSSFAYRLSPYDDAYKGATLKIYSGKAEGYKGTITSYNGATRTATVFPSFVDELPDLTTKYSLSFDEGDMRSFIVGSTSKSSFADVASSSIYNGESYISTKDYKSLIYALPDSPIKAGSIADQSFSYKYVFEDRNFLSDGSATLSITGEPGIGNSATFVGTGELSSRQVLENYLVVVKNNRGSANIANGQIISYTPTGFSVNVSNSGKVATFTAAYDAGTLEPGGFLADVVTTVNIFGGSQQGPKTKTYISGNNVAFLTGAANFGPYGSSNTTIYTGADRGQIYIRFPNTISGDKDDLYISDVISLVGVYESTTNTVSPGTAFSGAGLSDITNRYKLDNGQSETIYNHASIRLKSGYPAPRGAIVVVVDYYQHSGSGYFSVDSYTDTPYEDIPTYVDKKTNRTYNLRDCIDFRPVRTNGTNTAIDFTLTGNRIPIVDSNFTLDYQFYLPRIDKIVLKPGSEFQLISGVPSTSPLEPTSTDGDMLLYTLKVPAYTFRPKDIDVSMNDNRRYTMKDIGLLEQRIENLEYYSTLSLLEKKAMEKTILDNNGLDRTKYGTIVDSFTSFDVADETNPDFNAAINRNTGTLRPGREAKTIEFFVSNRNNTAPNNDIVTLRSVKTNAIEQKYASKFLPIQDFATPYVDGTISLSPEVDRWYDIEYIADNVVKSNTDTSSPPDNRIDDLGQNGYDLTSIPYIRSRPIYFLGEGLKSKRKHYAFFDNVPVRNYIARANKLTVTFTGSTKANTFIDINKGRTEQLISGSNSAPLLLVDKQHLYIAPENGDEFESFDPFSVDQHTKFVSQKRTTSLGDRTHSYTFNNEGNIYVFYNVYKALNSVEVYQANASPSLYYANGALNVNSTLVTKIFTANSTYTEGERPNNKEIKQYLSIPYTGANIAPSKYIGALGKGPEEGKFDQHRFGLFEYAFDPAEGNTVIVVVGREDAPGQNSPYQFCITRDGKNNELLQVGKTIYGEESGGTATITKIEHYSGSARKMSKNQANKESKIKLQKTAENIDNWYTGNTIYLISGKGAGQSRTITSYQKAGRIATVNAPWTVTPRANTIYSIGDLESNSDGDLPGAFFIPSTDALRFRTGERPFKLIDNTTNDSANSVSEATGTYRAEGYSVTAEEGVTLEDVIKTRPKDPKPVENKEPIFAGYPQLFKSTKRDPLAQSFFIEEKEYPRGIFLHSIDLYFKQKAETGAVRIAIHKMENGFPSDDRIAGGKAVVKSGFMDAPIPTDFNGAQAVTPTPVLTNFKFRSPVFLEPGEYCFIVKATSKDYELYFAEKGARDVATGTAIAKQPYIGTCFRSQSGTTWAPFLFQDLMFRINRCSFYGSGTVTLSSERQSDFTYFDKYHFKVKEVVPSGTSVTYEFKDTTNGSLASEWQNLAKNQDVVFPTIDGTYTRREVGQANGAIKIRATLTTSDDAVSPIIDLQRLGMKLIDININDAGIYSRNLKLVNKGSGYTTAPTVTISAPGGNGETATAEVTVNENGEIDDYAIVYPGSGYYTTPTVTVTGGGGSGAEFEIITEESPSDGNAETRYITKQVTLAEGFDAGDIKVFMDIYRPQGTNINVYYKVLNSNDPTLFENRPWMMMPRQGKNIVSRDPNDYYEIEYSADDVDGRIKYNKNDDEQQFRTFKHFALKIVLTSSQNNLWPKIRNFRAMALPGINT